MFDKISCLYNTKQARLLNAHTLRVFLLIPCKGLRPFETLASLTQTPRFAWLGAVGKEGFHKQKRLSGSESYG